MTKECLVLQRKIWTFPLHSWTTKSIFTVAGQLGFGFWPAKLPEFTPESRDFISHFSNFGDFSSDIAIHHNLNLLGLVLWSRYTEWDKSETSSLKSQCSSWLEKRSIASDKRLSAQLLPIDLTLSSSCFFFRLCVSWSRYWWICSSQVFTFIPKPKVKSNWRGISNFCHFRFELVLFILESSIGFLPSIIFISLSLPRPCLWSRLSWTL